MVPTFLADARDEADARVVAGIAGGRARDDSVERDSVTESASSKRGSNSLCAIVEREKGAIRFVRREPEAGMGHANAWSGA